MYASELLYCTAHEHNTRTVLLHTFRLAITLMAGHISGSDRKCNILKKKKRICLLGVQLGCWQRLENKYVNDIRHPPVKRVSTTSSSSSVNCRTVIDDVRDGHPQNTKPKNVRILLYLSDKMDLFLLCSR